MFVSDPYNARVEFTPKYNTMRVELNTGDWIEVVDCGDGIRLRGSTSLAVYPEVGNVVRVKVALDE